VLKFHLSLSRWPCTVAEAVVVVEVEVVEDVVEEVTVEAGAEEVAVTEVVDRAPTATEDPAVGVTHPDGNP
jgi:hypothetical protein